MDKLDRKILELLQKDGGLTAAELADRIGLSKAPCWRRIKRLQEDGVIKQTVALLNARSLNLGTTVFVTLKTANHSEAWFDKFVKAVRDIPEVTEIHRMSGDVDYLMRIVVPDIDVTMSPGFTALPAGMFMVQIAAVSHPEDADVLVGALRKRGYGVSVHRDPADALMHVEVGPFASRTDAGAMRQKLLNDGYNAIVLP